MKALTLLTSAFILAGIYSTAPGGNIRKVIPVAGKRVDVPEVVMNEIYGKVKTLFRTELHVLSCKKTK